MIGYQGNRYQTARREGLTRRWRNLTLYHSDLVQNEDWIGALGSSMPIPDTRWYLAPGVTLGDIAAAVPEIVGTSGEFDFAIPKYFHESGEYRRGVWSYHAPEQKVFGGFVSLADMLSAISTLIRGGVE